MRRFFHTLISAVLVVISTAELARATTQVSVETPEALVNALESAQPGTTILLEPGTYGDVKIDFNGAEFSPSLHIKSASAQHPARLRTLKVSNVTGLSLSALHIDLTATATTPANVVSLALTNTAKVTLMGLRMTGADAVAGVTTDVDPKTTNSKTTYIGHPLGNAMYIKQTRNLRITGNQITGFQRGITLVEGSDVLVSDNDIHDLRGTPFRSVSVDRIAVRSNRFHSFHPVNFGGYGDHADHIIFQPSKNRPDPVRDIIIEGNLLQQGEGEPILGIVLASRPGWPGYERVLIQNNILRNSDGAGIVLEGVRNGVVRRNTLVPSLASTIREPMIRVWFDCAEVLVTENIVPKIFVHQTNNDVRTIRVERNFVLNDRIKDYPRNIARFFATQNWAKAVLERRDFVVSNRGLGEAFGVVN